MKIIDNLKRPFRAIALALGLTASVVALSGCGSNGHEQKATQKAIDIIEDATEHIEKRKYSKLEDDLKKAEELVEHSGRIEDEGDTKDIANETEQAIYSAKTIIDNYTGISSTDNSIIGSMQDWYGNTQAETEWSELQSIVMNVEQWPEDEYKEYYNAMDELYTAVGNAIGRDSKEELEEAKDTTQEKEGSSSTGSKVGDAIEAGAEKAGETVGKVHNAFVNGLREAAEANSENLDGSHDYISKEEYERQQRADLESGKKIVIEDPNESGIYIIVDNPDYIEGR